MDAHFRRSDSLVGGHRNRDVCCPAQHKQRRIVYTTSWHPFYSVAGTSVTYNREATMPAASFYDVGDTWTEATPTFTQVTAGLKILGGDADVDNFLQTTYANPTDLEAEVIGKRAKAVGHLFSEEYWSQSVTCPYSLDWPRTTAPCDWQRGGPRSRHNE